jgi:hypothetical protein
LQATIDYISAQVQLLATLSYGRNDACATVIRTRFCDFEACFEGLKGRALPDHMRQSTCVSM